MQASPKFKSTTKNRHRGQMACLMLIVLTGLVGWLGFLRIDSPGAVRSSYDQVYRSLALNGPNYRDVVGYYTYCRKAVGSDTSTCMDNTRRWSQQLTLKIPFDKIAQDILETEASIAKSHKSQPTCTNQQFSC